MMVRTYDPTPEEKVVTFDKKERTEAGSRIFGLIVTGWKTVRGHIRMSPGGTNAYGDDAQDGPGRESVTLTPQ